MKPIQLALAPTRSRPLNMFLGMLLALVSVLLFLALASYHTADPSWNTSIDPAAPTTVHNWIGPLGAYLSDLLLQWLGFATFLIPLWMGGVAWGWMRSRPGGSAWLRALGVTMSLVFVPALFALLPWHWRFAHAVPVEGVIGRLVASQLVAYLNMQGAWLVAGALAAAGVYFASALSFWALKETLADRWIHLQSWMDRWRNWREERAERQADREEALAEQNQPGPQQRIFTGAIGNQASAEPMEQHRPSRLAALFGRRGRAPEPDPVDEIPAFQRAAAVPVEDKVPIAEMPRRTSIWERSPEPAATRTEPAAPAPIPVRPLQTAQAPMAAAPVTASAPVRPIPVEERPVPRPAAPAQPVAERPAPERPAMAAPHRMEAPVPPPPTPGAIEIHERADADVRTTTVAPRHVSGFKLPPSTLLNPGGGPQAIREDVLREEAKVLVEKCARVRCARPGGPDQPRADGDDLRVQARGGRQVLARHRAGGRSLPGDAGGEHSDRAHGGQEHGGHPGAEPRARDDSPARRAGVGDLCQGQDPADPGHGQRHQRPHRHGRSGLDAARADRRIDGIGQVGGHQRHDHEPAVPHHAGAGAG